MVRFLAGLLLRMVRRIILEKEEALERERNLNWGRTLSFNRAENAEKFWFWKSHRTVPGPGGHNVLERIDILDFEWSMAVFGWQRRLTEGKERIVSLKLELEWLRVTEAILIRKE